MTELFVAPASRLAGELELPGDKSVSHRALLLAAISEQQTRITGLAPGADVAATRAALTAMGVVTDELNERDVVVRGRGLRGLASDGVTIDAANSATLARLLAGILAGQPGTATITGDQSLSSRPMRRITVPLATMGARLECATGGTLPMRVSGARPLRAIELELDVASAQVSSSLLFAGMYADGPSLVIEPAPTRDHTVRMLRRCGVAVGHKPGGQLEIQPVERLQLPDTRIPGDISSAAPFMLAASLLHGSLLRLPNVGVNPGRTGFVDQLERMGARLGRATSHLVDGEPVTTFEVHGGTRLSRVPFSADAVATMIDEIPLLALAAQWCVGETAFRGIDELRRKESDRIAATVNALRRIGVHAEERRFGMIVRGSGRRPEGGEIYTNGDHRIAMLGAVAGLCSKHGVTIVDPDCVEVSFPGFFDAVSALRVAT